MRSPARPSEKRTATHHVTMIEFGRMQTVKTKSGSSAGRPVCNAAVKAQPTLTSAPSQERALEAVRSRVSRNCGIKERLSGEWRPACIRRALPRFPQPLDWQLPS